MSTFAHRSLLPRSAAPFEKIVSAVNASRLAGAFLRVALLRRLWDPWTCPAAQLPLLAWAWSVDIWNDAWPLERKRQVVAEARAFHQAKTTVAGFRMALGYVDAELVRTHLPRHGFVVARASTPAEHEAWLATLPEIRIYQSSPRTKASRPGFVAGRRPIGRAADAILDARRAELIRAGVATPLVFAGIRVDGQGRLLTEAERLVVPAPLVPGLKVGGAIRRPVRSARSGAERVIALQFTASGDPFLPNALSPSLTPVDVTPRRVFGPVPGGAGLAAGRSAINRRPIRRNRADEQLYLSIRLADGSAAGPGAARRGSALGRGRLQRSPFTAGLLVHAPLPVRAGFPVSSRIVRRGPEQRLAAIEHAIAVSQAARDTVFVDFNTVRPLTFGDLERMADLGPVRAGVSVRR